MSSYDMATNWGWESSDYEILQNASKLVKSSTDAWSQNAERYSDDYYFMFKDQWASSLKAARLNRRQEVLQMNYLYPFCQQIIGEELNNNPDIVVRPDSNKYQGPENNAEIVEGLIRKIWSDNNFNHAKTEAFTNGVLGGYGVLRVDYEYANPHTFDKKITIEAHKNPLDCFFDPAATNKTKSDSEYCGYFESFTKDKFWDLYPDATSDVSFKGADSSTISRQQVGNKKMVRVCHLWRKEYYKATRRS